MSTVLLTPYSVLVECPPAQRPSGRYTGTYRYSYSIGLQFKYTRTSYWAGTRMDICPEPGEEPLEYVLSTVPVRTGTVLVYILYRYRYQYTVLVQKVYRNISPVCDVPTRRYNCTVR